MCKFNCFRVIYVKFYDHNIIIYNNIEYFLLYDIYSMMNISTYISYTSEVEILEIMFAGHQNVADALVKAIERKR